MTFAEIVSNAEDVEKALEEAGIDYCDCNSCGEIAEGCHHLDSNEYCTDCYNLLPTCEGCSETVEEVDSNHLCSCCEEEYTVCEFCEELTHNDYIHETNRGDFRCENCLDDYIMPSDSRIYYHCDDVYYHRNDCYYTYPEEEESGINEYHSTKKVKISGSGDSCVGFELEVETEDCAETLACDLYDEVSNIHCESDGSLSDEGFEIISDYGDLKQVIKIAENVINVIKGKCVSHDANCCGLHVHLSKNKAPLKDIAKMVVFWNDPDNQEFIYRFSRRSSEDYAKVNCNKNKRAFSIHGIDRILEYMDDKYFTVNISRRETLEVRIFKGTTKVETLCACIEFAYYSWEFCKQNTNIEELTIENFVKFVPQSAKYFHNYLKEKSLCV